MLSKILPVLIASCIASFAYAEPQRVERGNLRLENLPAIPAEVTARLEQYQNARAAAFTSWLHDGGILITTRFADTNQIHRVRTPLGAREQLTFFAEPVNIASVSPDPALQGFIYRRDVGGNEFFQLYWFDYTTGESRLLTDGASRNTDPVWSNRGDRFAFSTTRRDGRNYDVYVGTPDSDAAGHRLALEGSGLWVPLDWSPDDRRLLVINYRSITDSSVYIVDLESGATTQVNPQDEPVGYGGALFDRSGRGVFLVHDQGAEFKQLHHLELTSGKSTPLSAEIPWDVSEFTLSPDRTVLAFAVNEGGMSKLHLRDLRRNRPMAGPRLPVGLVAGLRFSHEGASLAMAVNTPQSPSDVFVYKLRDRKLTRWTESEVGGLDTARFPLPELVTFPSFDGLEVPAWVYRPAAAGPRPVVIQIHGGPGGAVAARVQPADRLLGQ
jgi:dipeptidyl aminopeptidase/acylaminoacyl peptidase